MRNHLNLGFLIAVLAISILPAQLVAGEEQRTIIAATHCGSLGQQVARTVQRISKLMTPSDSDDEPDLVVAKELLDELRVRRWQYMNEFEKSIVLNFYAIYYLTLEDYQGAIRTLEEILQIEELCEDIQLVTLRLLDRVNAAEEDGQN